MLREGHEVVGATMKLWGGPSDSGCCSVADVEDARRVCPAARHHPSRLQLHVRFRARRGRAVRRRPRPGERTPNPCIACNAHLKFDRFLERAIVLGFDAIATGHHARVVAAATGSNWQLRRGRDAAKDQSYVLYMLGQAELARLRLPVGEMTKEMVRRVADELGLRTAAKPDSQDVCFISKVGGRGGFLGDRMPIGGGRLVTTAGDDIGPVEALELITVGQRRGLGLHAPLGPNAGTWSMSTWRAGRRRWGPWPTCWWSDRRSQPLVVGRRAAAGGHCRARATECPRPALAGDLARRGRVGAVVFAEPARRVAPGQAVVFYDPEVDDGEVVLGGGTALTELEAGRRTGAGRPRRPGGQVGDERGRPRQRPPVCPPGRTKVHKAPPASVPSGAVVHAGPRETGFCPETDKTLTPRRLRRARRPTVGRPRNEGLSGADSPNWVP